VLGCRKTKRLHERFIDLGLEMRAAFIGSSADRLSAFNPISSVANKHSATGNYLLLQVTTGRSIPSGEDGARAVLNQVVGMDRRIQNDACFEDSDQPIGETVLIQ
jgi:hypothetical protein